MKISKPKTLVQLHKIFWKIFSEYIRRRDADENGYAACCSCGEMHHWKKMDAGHYISRKHQATIYDEKNVHAQCGNCNGFLQGNATDYRVFLIKKYGLGEVEKLEAMKDFPAGFTRMGLILRIAEYKSKLKQL